MLTGTIPMIRNCITALVSTLADIARPKPENNDTTTFDPERRSPSIIHAVFSR